MKQRQNVKKSYLVVAGESNTGTLAFFFNYYYFYERSEFDNLIIFLTRLLTDNELSRGKSNVSCNAVNNSNLFLTPFTTPKCACVVNSRCANHAEC